MKRMTWLTAAFTAAVVLAFVGCSNPTTSEDDPSGVLGNIAGVVYDEVSGLPVQGAKVTLGTRTVDTDENGTYVINKVIPGNYTITVSKNGYSAYTVTTAVNPGQYLDDDPYLEATNLRTQISEFSDWIDAYVAANGPNAPTEYTGLGSLTDGTWTYNGDGVFVNEGGTATISVSETTNVDSAYPRFEVVYNKLGDYSYQYGIKTDIVLLKPLSGGFIGKIDVAFEVYSSVVQVSDTEPAAGVAVYFTDVGGGVDISDTDTADRVYGPFYTKEDGSFEASGLPANTEFLLSIGAFSQKKGSDEYFFDPQDAYTPGDWTSSIDLTNDTFKTATGNHEETIQETDEEGVTTDVIVHEGFVDIGKLVLFTVGNVAYVTGGNVPNADTPLAVDGSITLTFNKAIAANELVAVLTFDAANAVAPGGEGEQTLSVSVVGGNAAQVSLQPKTRLEEYSKVSLPYSVDEGKPVGTLTLTGTAKDGSKIYQVATIPVYTVEGLKLISYEYLSADAAARAVVRTEVGGAIKLTFNKPLSQTYLGTAFTINGLPADYRFVAGDDNHTPTAGETASAVLVYTDWEILNSVGVKYTVASAADTGDMIDAADFDAQLTVGAGAQLILKSTNLYTNAQGIVSLPDKDAEIFPLDGAITFTFVDIPVNAKQSVELKKNGAEVIRVTSTLDSTTLTIEPVQLDHDSAYTLNVRITDAKGVTLWAPAEGLLAVTGGLIEFHTTDDEFLISLIKTNLYTDENGITTAPPSGTDSIFPLDRDIEFTFDSNIEGNLVDVKLVRDTGSVPVVTSYTIDDDKLTISPAPLQPATAYTLTLRIADADGRILYTPPTIGTPGASGLIYVDTNNHIQFTTSDETQLVLKSVNLYTDPTSATLGLNEPNATVGDGVFGIGDAITLTFDNIPTTATVNAVLLAGTTPINARVAKDDTTVTITPAKPLAVNTLYTIKLRIYEGNLTLWKVPKLGTAANTGVVYVTTDEEIAFYTAPSTQYVVVDTNLYIDPETGLDQTPADDLYNFATDGVIELTFNELPAGATIKNLALKDADGGNIATDPEKTTVSGTTVIIAPLAPTTGAALNAESKYYLYLRVAPSAASNAEIWKPVSGASQYATAAIFGAGDPKEYIVFSTKKAEKAVLKSVNLYKDNNPVLYDTPNFPLNGTIELTFDTASIPAGTVVDYANTVLIDGFFNPVKAYTLLAADGKLTVKPEAPLTADATYSLRVVLVKPGANEPVWEPVTYSGSSGISGPVYVGYNGFDGYIVFTAAPQLALRNTAAPNVTNVTASMTNFDPADDIVLQFNLPIKATPLTAQLLYVDNSLIRSTTVSAGTLRAGDNTVLEIKPANLLAPNATYRIRFKVESEDGQTLVYDTTDTSATANSDITIGTANLPYYTGGAAKSPATITNSLAYNSANPIPLAKTSANFQADFTPPSTDFSQTYTIVVLYQNMLNNASVSFTVAMQDTTVVTRTALIPLSDTAHFAGEQIRVKVRGINNNGYAAESNILSPTFN